MLSFHISWEHFPNKKKENALKSHNERANEPFYYHFSLACSDMKLYLTKQNKENKECRILI